MASYKRRKSGGAASVVAVVGMMIVAVGMGGAIYWLLMDAQKPGVDAATLCPETGPVGHLAILVDTTDPMSLTQLEAARQHIEEKIDNAAVGTRISFSTVNPNGATRDAAYFSMCKPASGDEANYIYENPRLIEAQFQDEFAAPIQEAMDGLLSIPMADSSPIMESAQELAARIPDFAVSEDPRELVVMSDLVQHSEAFSFFEGDTWESFETSGGPSRFSSSFDGAIVTVLRIPRLHQRTAEIDDFWVRYFSAQGFDQVRVTKIGDL